MKRLIVLIVFISSSTLIFSQSEIKTTGVNLNLRNEPAIENNIICVVPKGSIFTVDYSNQLYTDWLLINYKGYNGYVFSKFVINPNVNNDYLIRTDAPVKYYKNSQGEKVQSPTYYTSPPDGATAECRDGTYSFSHNRRGTCSGHGGVKKWL